MRFDLSIPTSLISSKRGPIVDLVCIGCLISLCLFIALPRFRGGINWADEGFLAYGAVRVMEGQMPNRDFVSLQPPLSFYVVAAAFKIFGTSLATLRGLGLSIFLLVSLLIYVISRNFMTASFSFLAALPAVILGIPYFNFVPFAVWQGITISLAAILLFLRAIWSGRTWWAAVAGILISMSILLRHDQGVYLAISIAVLAFALTRARDSTVPGATAKKAFAFCAAGFISAALIVLTYECVHGALPEMFKQLLLFPMRTYARTSSLPFPHTGTALSLAQNATILLFYVAPLTVFAGVVILVFRNTRRAFGLRDALFVFLLVWTSLFYLQVITRSDLEHLFITLPPFFILIAYGCYLLQQKIPHIHMSIFLSAAILGSAFLWIVRPVILPDVKQKEILALARGGVRIEEGEWLTDFVRGVEQQVPPDRPILALPYQPMLYFLCERRNPTRWNYLWPGDQTEQDHRSLVDEARRDPPAVVFLTDESDFATYAPAIVAYVHESYRHAADFGPISVYFPNPPTP